MKLSAVVIALNEEDAIVSAIASCRFADEVLVVDGGSTDATRDVARNAGARVVERPFDDFARQRTFALEQASGEWVLFVDADERVPASLAKEIRAAIGRNGTNGYALPRRNMALGHWLGWHFGGEDAPVRLVRRTSARLRPQGVHEVIDVEGSTGKLTQPLVHLTHRSVGDIVDKINRYSGIEAAELAARGAAPPTRRAIAVEFTRAFRQLWRSGLRKEGDVGAIEAVLLAFNRTLVLAKLWEHTRHDTINTAYQKAEADLRETDR